MLDTNSTEKFVSLFESFVYESIEAQLKENNADMDSIREYVKSSILEWLHENEDELNEDVMSDAAVIEEMTDIFFAQLSDEINESDDEDDCDNDDCDKKDNDKEDDDKEDGEDDVDEATMVKHKISKIQSVLDKRKRETDPKFKMSRRRTLMKAAARGGRVINKKLSKSLKKSFRQGFGKRWESEDMFDNIEEDLKDLLEAEDDTEEKDDVEGDDVEPKDGKTVKKKLAKKIAEKCKVQKEAIEESAKAVLKTIPTFGTLNEDESQTLSESFITLLSETLDKSLDSVTESLLEEFDDYTQSVIIPSYNTQVSNYLNEEVIPVLESDVNNYLDYVINERFEELYSSGKIYKSRDSMQLESFREKLLSLIENELHIVPEQEDALIVMEHKCESLTESLKQAHVERIKMRNRATDLENNLWIEKNMPKNISEAKEEKIRTELENIVSEDHDDYVKQAKRIIDECTSSNNTTKTKINENVENKKEESKDNDIVKRTLEFMRR